MDIARIKNKDNAKYEIERKLREANGKARGLMNYIHDLVSAMAEAMFALANRHGCAMSPCGPKAAVRYDAKIRQLLEVDRTRSEVAASRSPIYELMAQYSSASMIVITRLVTAGSDGSGE